MGMENDLDVEEERRGERNKERNERREADSARAQGRDLQTTYYANNATITSQFLADCLLVLHEFKS